MTNSNLLKLYCTVIITVLGALCYANALTGEFIWDDRYLVQDNFIIKDWGNAGKVFSQDIGAGSEKAYNSYRPVQTITFMADYSLWQYNPKGYHLTNIILHITAALLVFWLSLILLKSTLPAFCVAALFVTHPIHTEAVTYISGRSDPLAAIFLLLAFISFIKCNHKFKIISYIATLFFYSLALLSREYCFIFALILVYLYSFKYKLKLKMFLPIIFITIIYFSFRILYLQSLISSPTNSTLLERLPGCFAALATYIRLLVLPVNLHMEYGRRLFSWTQPSVLIGILILIVMITWACRQKNKNPLIFFSIVFFLFALLPLSNLYPLNAYMAEHWLYFPSLGFFILLGMGWQYLYEQKQLKKTAILLFTGLLFFYSFLTARQNTYWQNQIDFFERTIELAPNNPKLYDNLGVCYQDNNQINKAIIAYKKAIEIDPSYANAYHNLGNIFVQDGEKEEAVFHYEKAIALNTKFADTYNNLGTTYRSLGENKKAITTFENAIELYPSFPNAYINLANVYATQGDLDKAATLYKKALEINPQQAIACNNLGLIYLQQKNNSTAIAYFNRAITINHNYAKPYYHLAQLFFTEGKYNLALKHAEQAKESGINDQNLITKLKSYQYN